MNIVQWCNYNEGFTNAILSMLTLAISVIAICCSIKVAYIPYKKKILINPAFWIKEDMFFLELEVANLGNKLIGINYITVEYRDTDVGGNNKRKFIEPSKIEKYTVDMNLKYEEIKYDKDANVKIIIYDTEGKKYKFKSGLALG